MIRRIFKYIEPLWLGSDGKVSKKDILALYLSYKFVENLDYGIQKWAADRSLEGLSSSLMILAGLIVALFGLGTWKNISDKRIDTEALLPPNTTVTVEKAETIVNRPIITNGDKTQTDSTTTTTNTSTNPNEEPINAK